MKVAVIIPSYNEADNIAFVTKVVDKGLAMAFKRFSKITEATIINVDNSSRDNTSGLFKKIVTKFPKLSLKTKGRPGKGKNLIYFLKNFYKTYDLFITLDADLRSIRADWIVKLLTPFFDRNKDVDFVWPLYKRSRFEGSTTNHFAYPVIYTFFRLDIRQPIAGDFAFSRRIAAEVIRHKIPKEAYNYGIDILFSIRAAQYARDISQITLGSKVHKPSFSKLENMFVQVASAAMDSLKSGRKHSVFRKSRTNKSICISDSQKFIHRDAADKLLSKNIDFLLKNLQLINWLDNQTKKQMGIKLARGGGIDEKLWSAILSNWLSYARGGRLKDSLKISQELLPFFVLRTVSFWNESLGLNSSAVEGIIKKQTRMVRHKFN